MIIMLRNLKKNDLKASALKTSEIAIDEVSRLRRREEMIRRGVKDADSTFNSLKDKLRERTKAK